MITDEGSSSTLKLGSLPLLRGTILNRTYGIQENLYMPLFLRTAFLVLFTMIPRNLYGAGTCKVNIGIARHRETPTAAHAVIVGRGYAVQLCASRLVLE